jgi:hypothetical protein
VDVTTNARVYNCNGVIVIGDENTVCSGHRKRRSLNFNENIIEHGLIDRTKRNAQGPVIIGDGQYYNNEERITITGSVSRDIYCRKYPALCDATNN